MSWEPTARAVEALLELLPEGGGKHVEGINFVRECLYQVTPPCRPLCPLWGYGASTHRHSAA